MSYIPYIDKLVNEVKQVFSQAADQEDLQKKVIELIQKKTKGSFINGLKAAKNQQFKPKGQNSQHD